jgi:hypothetical protein
LNVKIIIIICLDDTTLVGEYSKSLSFEAISHSYRKIDYAGEFDTNFLKIKILTTIKLMKVSDTLPNPE